MNRNNGVWIFAILLLFGSFNVAYQLRYGNSRLAVGTSNESLSTLTLTLPRFTWAAPEVTPPRDHTPLYFAAGKFGWTTHYTTQAYLDTNRCLAYTGFETFQVWLPREEYGEESTRTSLLHELMHIASREGGGQYRKITPRMRLLNRPRRCCCAFYRIIPSWQGG